MKTGIVFKAHCLYPERCEFKNKDSESYCDYTIETSSIESYDTEQYCFNFKACRQEMMNQYGETK